ncbi:MAG: hypothetical protein GY702_16435 [Desulfobulbaceae bacterium]|nr:hypothetical protein [Desulfobulbaceae bacterium]
MNEPGALDERLRTLVTQSFEGGGERLLLHYVQKCINIAICVSTLSAGRRVALLLLVGFSCQR